MPKIRQKLFEVYKSDDNVLCLEWHVISGYRDFHEWTHDNRTCRFEINNTYIWLMDYYGALEDDQLEAIAINLYKKHYINRRLAKHNHKNNNKTGRMGKEPSITVNRIQRELPLG